MLERMKKELEKELEKSLKYTISLETLLGKLADGLEPKTHCCECSEGEHKCKHTVHIQYPDCTCKKEGWVLRKNV